MNNNDPIPQEAYYPLSMLFTVLGASLNTMGVYNVLEGRNNNVSSVRELGERQIKMGRYFAFLSAYIKEGILPDPVIMKYLSTH